MTRLFDGIRRHAAACFGTVLFFVCAAVAFWPVLPKFMALASPDSGPYFHPSHCAELVEGLVTGGAFTPQILYWLLLPPLYAHELTYIVDSFVLALAGVYYLTGRRAAPAAAWAGGLALGLSGYTFTLFCAGHRGYFHMFACAVWAFGLLARCFEGRRLRHFALLGLVFAWGVPYQPDVLVLVGAVAAFYALWLTAVTPAPAGASGPRRGVAAAWANALRVWPRFALSVAVLAAVGFGGLRSAVTTQMASRDAQIAGVTATEAEAKKAAAPTAAARHERWIFATNWSLPPEDALEFVAPGVFGDETMQPPYPYWGRLGRPSDEVFQKGRMMPNYRGHTVYLGVVPVIFAVFGVLAWVARRPRRGAPPVPAAHGADVSDVPFWCAVWMVCLIFAMGRYTPLYRLFYSLPYMDYIRAPVKFLHVVEIATAFLAGFGVDAFLSAQPRTEPLHRRLAAWAGCVAAFLVLAAGLMLANKADLVRHIASLGMGSYAEALSAYAVQNLMRSACLAAVVAGLGLVVVKRGLGAPVKLACALVVVLALDQAWVARRYVRVINVTPLYRENAVVKAIKKSAYGQPVNVVNYATPNVMAGDWFSTSLSLNGIANLAPEEGVDSPCAKLFAALQKDPVRLWKLCHVQYVIAPRRGCEALIRAGTLVPVLDFELGAGVVRHVSPGEASLVLARVSGVGAAPRFLSRWQPGIAAGEQVQAAVGSGAQDVSDAPLPSGGVSDGAAEVSVLCSRGFGGALESRVRVSTKAPGLLVFDERLTGAQEVLVDGRPVPLRVADAAWPAAEVPEGDHIVTLRKPRSRALAAVSALVALALVAWWGIDHLASKRLAAAG